MRIGGRVPRDMTAPCTSCYHAWSGMEEHLLLWHQPMGICVPWEQSAEGAFVAVGQMIGLSWMKFSKSRWYSRIKQTGHDLSVPNDLASSVETEFLILSRLMFHQSYPKYSPTHYLLKHQLQLLLHWIQLCLVRVCIPSKMGLGWPGPWKDREGFIIN